MVQHLHKYRRVNIANANRGDKHFVMQCQAPGCTHYTHMKSRVSCPQLIGKMSICNKCNDPFLMDRRSLRLAKPTCIDCSSAEKELKDPFDFVKPAETSDPQ